MANDRASYQANSDTIIEFVRHTKDTALDVIEYEINMLRACRDVLVPAPPRDQLARNVYLEAYLVHYRGLLEFFAQPLDRVRPTDLSVRRPTEWASSEINPIQVASITSLAEPLHRLWFNSISQQLAHCTQPRY